MSMLRTPFRCACAAILLLIGVAQAHAASITVTTPAVPTITPSGSPDSFSLNAGSNTFNVPTGVPTTVGYQTGDFFVAFSAFNGVTFPFSYTEDVTINGDTQAIVFTGGILVTPSVDTLSINGVSPLLFAGSTVVFQPLDVSVPANTAGTFAFTEQANITSLPVPEPASLALFGLGLMGVGFVRRRKAS
jgi:hypothetical protein